MKQIALDTPNKPFPWLIISILVTLVILGIMSIEFTNNTVLPEFTMVTTTVTQIPKTDTQITSEQITQVATELTNIAILHITEEQVMSTEAMVDNVLEELALGTLVNGRREAIKYLDDKLNYLLTHPDLPPGLYSDLTRISDKCIEVSIYISALIDELNPDSHAN